MKHLFDHHQAWREPLRMVMVKKWLERLAVGGNAIGPEVLAHQRACFRKALLDEGQGHVRCRRVAQLLERYFLGLLEGLKHRSRKPRVLFGQSAPYADQMHDRKNA